MGKSKKEKAKYEKSPRVSISQASIDEAPAQKLTRKEYEEKLSDLHVELVQLQQWVRREKKKVCIAFEGRDGAGKGGVIKALTSASARACSASWRCPRRRSAKNRKCICSAIFRIFPRPAKSSFSTEAGITEPASNASWGFARSESRSFFQLAPAIEKAMIEAGIICRNIGWK